MASSRRNLFVILICFLTHIISTLGNSPPPITSERKVQGAVAEAINSSLFYQSYSPLILKFRIPDWTLEAIRLNKTMKCSKDDSGNAASDFICPVSKYMDEVLNPLSQTMRFYRNIFNASGGLFYEHNFSCDKIRPHFLHFSAPIGGLLPYINEFKNRCSLGKNATLTPKTLVSTAPLHATSAYQKFRDLHEAKEQQKGTSAASFSSEWKSLHTAGYLAIQNSYLLSQYADSVRWANAFTSCQSYKLDIGLVSPLMLNDSLTDLAKSLEGSGYAFALPFLNTLPHYYKIPLVDCMLTMTNTIYFGGFKSESQNDSANLIVRILIPVIKSGVTYKTLKLNKVPFLKKDKGQDKICEIQNFQPEDVYLLETNVTTKVETIIGRISTLCLSSKLCKIPEVTHRQVIDPCIQGIITSNHNLTSERCHFECTMVPNSIVQREKLFPIVTQLLPNKYAITGLSPDGLPMLLLECSGRTTHMFKPNTTEGVILVRLPCDCELVHGQKRYSVQKPCDELLHVEHVLEFDVHKKSGNDVDDHIDYLVEEPKDSKAFNITFPESQESEEMKNRSLSNDSSNSTQKATSQKQSHQQLHCGHVVLWMFLLSVLVINLFTLFILYKNNLLSLNSILICRGSMSGISRLENEIPVNNMSSSM